MLLLTTLIIGCPNEVLSDVFDELKEPSDVNGVLLVDSILLFVWIATVGGRVPLTIGFPGLR